MAAVSMIYVEVTEPVALIMAGGHRAHVKYTGEPGARLSIEDADTGEIIGYATAYLIAGRVFGDHHGMTGWAIDVKYD